MADKVIALACAAGMSTSLLVSKCKKQQQITEDYEIFAKSTADIDNMLAGTGSPKPDVLLLGPQVAFMKGEVAKKLKSLVCQWTLSKCKIME